jgi:transcriptional regulator with XRE-family HTH domain
MTRSLSAPGPTRGPVVRDLVALGQLVRNRRLALALRIDDAARACGVAANVLSRLENGGPIGVDRLLRVLSGLGLTLLVMTKDDALQLADAMPTAS